MATNLIANMPELNVLGKPRSRMFDPKYRKKYKTPRIKGGGKVRDSISAERWQLLCETAKVHWNNFRREGIPLPVSHAMWTATPRPVAGGEQ
jgi:hypothetical protein